MLEAKGWNIPCDGFQPEAAPGQERANPFDGRRVARDEETPSGVRAQILQQHRGEVRPRNAFRIFDPFEFGVEKHRHTVDRDLPCFAIGLAKLGVAPELYDVIDVCSEKTRCTIWRDRTRQRRYQLA